jgi:hypothetical protein
MATTTDGTSRGALVQEARDARMRTADAAQEAWQEVAQLVAALQAGDAVRIAQATERADIAHARLVLAIEGSRELLARLRQLLASRANPAVSGLTNVPPPASATTPSPPAKPAAPFGGKLTPKPKP